MLAMPLQKPFEQTLVGTTHPPVPPASECPQPRTLHHLSKPRCHLATGPFSLLSTGKALCLKARALQALTLAPHLTLAGRPP